MPLLLDLFCGAGGAAEGYHEAGFEVVGVDIHPQPRYPFDFVLGDAIEFLKTNDQGAFDLIHASPPCQPYSRGIDKTNIPRLINQVRVAIAPSHPYVIENVMGAKYSLNSPTLLCGYQFGLRIQRHRLFEHNFKVLDLLHKPCKGRQVANAREAGQIEQQVGLSRKFRSPAFYSELLGIKHEMTLDEVVEAIPPAYTKWLGQQFWERGDAR